MIAKALTFLTSYLNNQIKALYGLDKDTNAVVASSLINPDGVITDNIENQIVISVINIEHETFMKGAHSIRSKDDMKFGKVAPPVYLNLYLLISSNYSSRIYTEGLKRLSSVITLLQASPYFTKQEYSNMEDPLEKLTMEIYNIPITELSHIWSGIGAKYVPSIVYKMRLITLQDDKVKKVTPAITGLGDELKSN